MKVCCYFPNKPFRYGSPSGDRTISEHLVDALVKKGHSWVEASSFRSRLFWLYPDRILTLPLETVAAIRRFLELRPDVWLTYHSYYKSPDLFGWWIGKLKKPDPAKYVIFQGMYSTGPKKKARFKAGYLINSLALMCADLVFSNNLMDLPGLKRIVPGSKLIYLPPGIFPEEFAFSEQARSEVRLRYGIKDGDRVVLSVCRFRPGVKYESMKFLFASLRFVRTPFKLLLIGTGPMYGHVERLAGNLEKVNEKSYVILLGQIARSELWRYYSAADLFAFPGIGESLGMVYLEAQACGLPVIALKGPGVAQVIRDGETGFLVNGRDPEKYARVIESLLEDENLRKLMGESAREFVARERNAHKHYARFVDILEGLVENDS
ncbi:glycosyltransferase family 4 protein [Thermodesulforhabdus norvegica]|uniref:Glycosyltransferase involved in cell wall bisynthesis n=1 Tax=Thermodesulforhabdus norvegica TaxID=39841 RepID=A0A1I4T7Q2_9BACT|nr:glycosyltransferase family 4 protein [Thermodesulforhabdus norvegica]SFM72752.1 Glycosyltransferase involved in cell wall bisynthesis [Thermodesulforhabdus norvegica]